MAVGSKCGTTDYRTKKKEKISRAKAQREPSSEKIFNRRFTPINADDQFFNAKRIAQGAKGRASSVLSNEC